MVLGLPSSAMMKPEVVNIPVPIILAITKIVAEKNPISLFRRLLFKLFFKVVHRIEIGSRSVHVCRSETLGVGD